MYLWHWPKRWWWVGGCFGVLGSKIWKFLAARGPTAQRAQDFGTGLKGGRGWVGAWEIRRAKICKFLANRKGHTAQRAQRLWHQRLCRGRWRTGGPGSAGPALGPIASMTGEALGFTEVLVPVMGHAHGKYLDFRLRAPMPTSPHSKLQAPGAVPRQLKSKRTKSWRLDRRRIPQSWHTPLLGISNHISR